MSRAGRRKTGGTRTGLCTWGPHGETPDVVEDNPLLRRCGFCGAAPRQPCRRPARGGHAPIHGFHDARQPAPDEPQAPVPAPSRPMDARTDPQ